MSFETLISPVRDSFIRDFHYLCILIRCIYCNFEYFNFNNGFDSYDIIANYEYDENHTQKDLKYYIEITRLGYVLTSYDRDTDNHKKYKIETDNSRILLTEITPPNNGAELLNAIVFKN